MVARLTRANRCRFAACVCAFGALTMLATTGTTAIGGARSIADETTTATGAVGIETYAVNCDGATVYAFAG